MTDLNAPDIRSKGLGASDAAPACGLSRYKSQLALYMEKIGEISFTEETEPMRWGRRLEPIILDAFCERMKRTPISVQERVHHPDIPWMWSTLDCRLSADELVETKTCNGFMAKNFGQEGTDQIPDEYALQATHQLACTGAKIVYVPLLIGGQHLKVYEVERNEKLIGQLIDMESAFWGRVLAREAPDPDFRDPATAKLLLAHYGFKPDATIELGNDALEIAADYESAKEAIKDGESGKEWAKNKLLALMGSAAIGYMPDGTEIHRKEINRKAYAVEATSYMDFRIKKAKVRNAR